MKKPSQANVPLSSGFPAHDTGTYHMYRSRAADGDRIIHPDSGRPKKFRSTPRLVWQQIVEIERTRLPGQNIVDRT
jgi:hypothetical protein